MSGPASAAAAGAATFHPPASAPPRARPSRRSRPRTGLASTKAPWRVRPAAYARSLPDLALLDRIVRGRAWIPLLGILLAGIVAMQVEVLKLNAGIGRSLERSSALQAQNELLRAGVTGLSDEQRIERIAAQMGMVMPAPEQMRFVNTGSASVDHAVNGVKAPNAPAFEAALPTIGQPAAAQGTSTNVGVGTAAATVASTTAAGSTTATGSTTAGTAATTAGTAATTAGTAASTAGTTATTAGTAATTSGTGAPTTATTPTLAATGAPSTADTQSSSSSSGGATPVGG